VGHNTTIVFLILAGLLRLLNRMFDYGVLVFIAAHSFFSSQIGLSRFAVEAGIDPAAWSAYWVTAASVAVGVYLAAMRGQPREIP
jgi:hypothetical protein